VSRETYNTSGVRTMSRTYHFDALGSTRALTDPAGAVTDRYAYDAWGNLDSTGTWHHSTLGTTDNPYQYVGRYGYYTHYQEPSFGLMQLGVRFYDSETGRFTQRDPVQDGMNWYGYVGGNPLGRIDPGGMWYGSPDSYFMWHYLFGKRRDVDLAEMGFLGSYRATGAVRGAVASWKTEVSGHVRDKARRECGQNPSAQHLITGWDSGGEAHSHINTILDRGWFTVAEHSFFTRASCTIFVNCCKRKYAFMCVLGFRMHDYWADTLGIGVGLGGFSIDGKWAEDYGGRGSF